VGNFLWNITAWFLRCHARITRRRCLVSSERRNISNLLVSKPHRAGDYGAAQLSDTEWIKTATVNSHPPYF